MSFIESRGLEVHMALQFPVGVHPESDACRREEVDIHEAVRNGDDVLPGYTPSRREIAHDLAFRRGVHADDDLAP